MDGSLPLPTEWLDRTGGDKEILPRRWMAKDPYESDQVIETVGDGIIEVRSADDPESLVGVGLDIVLITEV